MNYLAKSEKDKKIFFDILGYAAKAAKEKKKNPRVINSCIGTLTNENGLVRYKSVEKAINDVNILDFLAYGPSAGSVEANKAMIDYFMEDYADEFKKTCIITPGGTSAVAMAVKNYCENTFAMAIPAWGNYKTVAEEAGKKVVKYEMFVDGKFNIDGCIDVINQDEKIFLLLNTPANNPSGYRLTNAEINELYRKIEALNKPAVICFDVAYIDYADKELFETLNNFKGLVLVACSLSKTLGVYGQRVGSLICLSHNQNDIDDFDRASMHYARGTYSLINRYAEEFSRVAITKYKTELKEEIAVYKNELAVKMTYFKKLADEHAIEYLPCSTGFFVTIKLNNTTLEKLNDDGIYLLPNESWYRVSICALTMEEIGYLINKLDSHK